MHRWTVVLALVVFAACEERSQPLPLASVHTGQPRDGGTLVRRLESQVRTLNPVLVREMSERYVAQYLFTPLVYLDEHNHPVAGIAEKWSISDDRRVYTFHLNPRATYSNGMAVRASDVVFTLKQIKDPANASEFASSFEHLDLERTQAIGTLEVVIVFRAAVATQLESFAEVRVLPEAVYGNGAFRDDFHDRAIGSGPYTLAVRDAARIVVERRESYWRDKPHIQRVVFRVIEDFGTAWRALKVGEVDESYIPSAVWERGRTTPDVVRRRLAFREFLTPSYTCVAWNARHPLLRDKRVRRALAMSVDVNEFVVLHGGTARPLTGPFALSHDAYNRAVPPIPYAPQEAKRMLAELGWRDTNGDGVLDNAGTAFRFTLLVPNKSTEPYAEMIQAALKRIGVDVGLQTMDFASVLERIQRNNYDATYYTWNLGADPDLYTLFHSSQRSENGNNFVWYSNAEVDALLERARVATDSTTRRALQHRIHEIIADEQPYSWYMQVTSKWGFADKVHGVRVSPLAGLYLWYPGEFGWWVQTEN